MRAAWPIPVLLLILPALTAGCVPPDPEALHGAAREGDLALVDELIARGVDVRAVNGIGWTPLHSAITSDNAAVVAAIVKAGAIVDQPMQGTGSSMTALHLAAMENRLACVDVLLAANASMGAHNASGRSALMWAAIGGADAVIERLLEAGAAADAATGQGFTALHFSKSPAGSAMLLEAGAELDARNERGATPLHHAAGGRSPARLRFLVERGADVTAATESGDTALHIVAGRDVRLPSDDVEAMLVALLDAGAPVDVRNDKGRTPLMEAAELGQLRTVERLLEHGADATLRDARGRSAVDIAANRMDHDPDLLEAIEAAAGTPVSASGRPPRR